MRFQCGGYRLVIQLLQPIVRIKAGSVLGLAACNRVVNCPLQRFGQVAKCLLQVVRQAVQPLAFVWIVAYNALPCQLARQRVRTVPQLASRGLPFGFLCHRTGIGTLQALGMDSYGVGRFLLNSEETQRPISPEKSLRDS
jgi:hypothetical protein